MDYFFFIFKSAVEDFQRNKVRTFLTSLGILIGVSSVVLLVAFGLGLKKYINNQFESLGTNLIIAMPGKMLEEGSLSSAGSSFLGGIKFDEKDAANLKNLENTLYVVPVFMKTITTSAEGNSEIGDLYATTSDVFPIRNLEPLLGTVFSKNDLEKKNKVTVLGPKIAEKLYSSVESALGRIIKIEDQAYKVIGILKAKGGGFGGPDFDSFVYIPYTSAGSFNPQKTFYAINIKTINSEVIPEVKEKAKKILLKRYKEDDFSVAEQTEIMNIVSSIFAIINTILIGIATISLVVGGIGIMNIMYVSVIERTREIGIRRAIGATGKDILYQFLVEAVILSLIGGLFGLLLSFITVILIQRFFPAYIDLSSIIAALSVSSFIGIIFGVFPAKRAADLSPIEAIRYE